MRLPVRIITVVVLILVLSTVTAKSANSKTLSGKARLEKYDIAFNDTNFIKYLYLDNAEVIQAFIEAGYDPNTRDEKHDPVLLIAAENDFFEIAKVLLEGGAYPDSGDWDHTTPLMYACYKQNTKIVKLLLKHNASINLQNRSGCTALMFAIKGGNGSTIDEVLTKDTDLSLKTDKGITAKDLALSFKYFYLANYLEDKVDFLNGRYVGKERFSTVKLREL